MPAEIPMYFGGIWNVAQSLGITQPWDSAYNDTIPTINGPASNYIYPNGDVDLLPPLMRMLRTEAPLLGVVRGCPNTCQLKLRAPALMSTCEAHEISVNYTKPVSEAAVNSIFNMAGAPPRDWLSFQISTSLVVDDIEKINLVVGCSTTDQCVGVYRYSVCTLASAIGEYDVSVTGDKVFLDDPGHPRILAVANNTPVAHQTTSPHDHNSTLGLLEHAAYVDWDSYAAYFMNKGQISSLGTNGGNNWLYHIDLHQPCPSFTDPKEDVIAGTNQMMVYMGVLALRENASYFEERMDPGWPVNTTATAAITGQHNIYETDYRFFIAAAMVELACILLVAPTYWGWRNLGRPVSFLPLEVAKAFESPLLSDVNSNSSGRDLARTVGDVHVRYGATKQYGLTGPTKLAFANPDCVERPVKETKFDV